MTASASLVRAHLRLQGAVQGVGFRPFVYRLAHRLGLSGWVENTTDGVRIEVEGLPAAVETFQGGLTAEAPKRAVIRSIDVARVEPHGTDGFTIRASPRAGVKSAPILPDLATCDACLREVADPRDRRFRYPFINCTDCGPRYTIVLGLPYDRAQTTMSGFVTCDRCRGEYEDPASRRFHAEAIACPDCGPQLALWAPDGRVLFERDEALLAAADVVRAGGVLAQKGLGGFQLAVDAGDDAAVRRLRERKRREEKPFAVMASSLAAAGRLAHVTEEEAALLSSPEAPIVLLRRRDGSGLSDALAPGNPYVGLMLPTTPMHHLLLRCLDGPIVATSGNLAEEPICVEEREATLRLRGVADAFLVHDRPIARHVDDSVVRMVDGRPMLLRRARGYAPLPVVTGLPASPVLAVGAHQKNTIALSAGGQAILSPHVGDLDTELALGAFDRTIGGLSAAYALDPVAVACDAHPDYASTRRARRLGRPAIAVQHHYAHVLAGMADNGLAPPVLGVAWDGSGFGPDGTIWGGEFLRVDARSYRRIAHLRTFRLPGGDKAVREPRRSAAAAAYEIDGAIPPDGPVGSLFSDVERGVLVRMLGRGVNAPLTSSAGRLFDAVAAIVGLHAVARFEGQAAMALEFALDGRHGDEAYPFEVRGSADGWILDWKPMLRALLNDAAAGEDKGAVSLRFHNTLAEMIVEIARRAGEPQVVLTGGCFQNRYLAERALAGLRREGFKAYTHHQIPPNDGGIAVGQLLAALREMGE